MSPQGDRIVFTSTRDGDIDIYSMALDGSDVKRLTDRVGYEGGPFFSPDGTEIVFRASYPETEEATADYQRLLGQNLIRPGILNLYIMDADGSNQRLVLANDAANFAPYFTPDGGSIIFSSNLHNPEGRNFDLFLVRRDGTGLEQVTHHEAFDGFPMFSPDGTKLVWASNRNNTSPRDTNVFIADWVSR